jgi:dolichol-phosphate mannosyltransferase
MDSGDPRPSLSIIVPALDEELHVADAVAEISRAVSDRFRDWEILLFDDGSRDRTGAIMDGLADSNPRIRVTHNATPHNLGGVYKQGVAMARYDHVVMIPGDNENPSGAMAPVFDAIGSAEIVLPYPENNETRSKLRVAISKSYVALLNALFALDVPYYNGTVVHRTDNVRSTPIETDSFAYQSELLLKLLSEGKSWTPVPIRIEPRPGRRSKALRLRNVVGVVRTILGLYVKLRVLRRLPAASRVST